MCRVRLRVIGIGAFDRLEGLMMRMVFVLVCLMGLVSGGCTRLVWSGPRVEPLREGGGVVESGLHRGMPYVMVSIDGGEPRKFLFDTGSTFQMISPDLAKEMGLKKRGNTAVKGASGQTKAMPFTLVDRVEFGPVVMEDSVFLLRDIRQILPFLDDDIAGLIGISGLAEFTIDIDYPNRSVAITSERLDPQDPSTNVLYIAPSGLYWVPVMAQDSESGAYSSVVWSLLDTGNVGSFDLDRRMTEPLVIHEQTTDGHGSIGIHGVGQFGQQAPLRSGLMIGRTTLEGVQASINDIESRLSSEEFQSFRVRIDGKSGLVSFTRSDGATRLVSTARFGITKLWQHNGYRVENVTDGSAADLLGISGFDRILAIDGVEPTNLHLKAAYWAVAEDAETVTVRVLRESDESEIEVVLPVNGTTDSIVRRERINAKHGVSRGTITTNSGETSDAEVELTPLQ